MIFSKKNIKLITSLQQKKYRQKHGLFVAEGVKVVNELLNSKMELYGLFGTEDSTEKINSDRITIITEEELKKISTLKTPNKVLAIFKIPKNRFQEETEDIEVALDGINDPGNLGTIIRLCDWFGVKKLICSKNTVDCYNSKVIQATMGSLTRVYIEYVDLVAYLESKNLPIYITDMEGDNIYQTNLPEKAIIVMGNEANGISQEIKSLINKKLTIPRFGNVQQTESLNVATATSILLSEFRRSLV
ncbi:RNA methyltransferase [Tenacibaculum sp. 190524A02b]|uniref:TrmH family RNA methyltransferase n=1 Tax=Tenacibaculum vairaonense TaxID=3137860 RepID=UPI0031FB093B